MYMKDKDKEHLSFLCDKKNALFGRQTECLLLGNKQNAFIGGQTGCLYWETNRMPSLLGDKQDAFIGRQSGCLYWETIRMPFLWDKETLFAIGIIQKHFFHSNEHRSQDVVILAPCFIIQDVTYINNILTTYQTFLQFIAIFLLKDCFSSMFDWFG